LLFINQCGISSIIKLIEKFINNNVVNLLAKAIKELLNGDVDIFIEYLKENSELITTFLKYLNSNNNELIELSLSILYLYVERYDAGFSDLNTVIKMNEGG